MLRKFTVSAALIGFAGYVSLTASLAQDLPPDDFGFEIETVEAPEKESLLQRLGQYVGATIGTNNGTSNAVDKTMSAASFRLDLPQLAGLKTAIAFDIGAYENIYKLELNANRQQTRRDCQANVPTPDLANPDNMTPQELQYFYDNECYYVVDDEGNYLPTEQQRIVDDNFAALTEGYVQWEPTSFATLRVGRQPIVLGQFEIFSPLMFAAPMKATGTKTKASKADFSFPQDGVQLSVFPLPQLELSVTAIPEMRIDAAHRKRFEEFAKLKSDFVNYAPGENASSALQEIADHDMTLARLIYYGDRFTLGLSAIQGAETNEDPRREARLTALPCGDFFDGGAPLGSECQSDPFTAYALSDNQGLRFSDTDVLAIELAVRISSKLSFVFEQTNVDGEKELGILPFGAVAGERPRIFNGNAAPQDPLDPNFDPYQGTIDLSPLFQQLIAQNQGKPYINVDTIMRSAGLVYKGERWLFNLQIAQRIQEGASAQEEAWRKQLDYDTYFGDDTEENGTNVIPIINAVRLLGAEKQGYIGAGFGTFGQNFGFGASAGWRLFERLEIGAFGGLALDVTGADEIEAEGYDTPEDEGYINIGMNYLF